MALPFRIDRKPATMAVAALLALAACNDADRSNVTERAADRQAVAENGAIDCALAGAAAFARTCTVERASAERGVILTVRHPDGGFRRLVVTDDGRGVAAADGAEAARVTIVAPDQIEVAVGRDRYRLPATVGSKAAR